MSDPKRGTTVKAASLHAGVSDPTTYKAIKSGALKAKKIGRRTIVLPEWQDEWIDSMPDAKDVIGGAS